MDRLLESLAQVELLLLKKLLLSVEAGLAACVAGVQEVAVVDTALT